MDPKYDYGSSTWYFHIQHIWCDQRHLSEVAEGSYHRVVFFESDKEYEFSCKFDDTQWEEILQMLKEFFCTFEDDLWWAIIFEKEKEKKVQKNHAWANESELIKESKVNLVWQSSLIRTG